MPSRSGGVFDFDCRRPLCEERQRLHPRQRQRDAHAAEEVTP